MNAMTEFSFHTHAVRVLPTEDGSSFVVVATDVAQALEYRDASDMLRCIDEEDKGYTEVRTPGGTQRLRTINESGVYTATFRSRKEAAKPFRRWVTAEVLPAIRRTGGYSGQGRALTSPPNDYVAMTPEEYAEARADLEEIQARLASARIVISADEYVELNERRLLVGKKVHLVRELVAFLESRGISREVAAELTGHDRNAIRQAAYRARKTGN